MRCRGKDEGSLPGAPSTAAASERHDDERARRVVDDGLNTRDSDDKRVFPSPACFMIERACRTAPVFVVLCGNGLECDIVKSTNPNACKSKAASRDLRSASDSGDLDIDLSDVRGLMGFARPSRDGLPQDSRT